MSRCRPMPHVLSLLGAITCLVTVTVGCGSAPSAILTRGVESTPASSSAGPSSTAATSTSTDGSASTGNSTHLLVRLSRLRLPTPTTRSVAFPTGSSIVLAGGFTTAGTTGTVLQIPVSGG